MASKAAVAAVIALFAGGGAAAYMIGSDDGGDDDTAAEDTTTTTEGDKDDDDDDSVTTSTTEAGEETTTSTPTTASGSSTTTATTAPGSTTTTAGPSTTAPPATTATTAPPAGPANLDVSWSPFPLPAPGNLTVGNQGLNTTRNLVVTFTATKPVTYAVSGANPDLSCSPSGDRTLVCRQTEVPRGGIIANANVVVSCAGPGLTTVTVVVDADGQDPVPGDNDAFSTVNCSG